MSDVKKYMDNLFIHYPILESLSDNIFTFYSQFQKIFTNNKTLFVCGNGGSCSDAEHFVGELGKGFLSKRSISKEFADKLNTVYPNENLDKKLQGGFRVISLNGHPSLATAYINDVDPFMVYAQQLFVFGQEGDGILGISTSGNAKNILNLFKIAKVMNIKTFLLTGNNNQGLCRPYADFIIDVPVKETYRIQEFHLPIYHTLAMMLEEKFFNN